MTQAPTSAKLALMVDGSSHPTTGAATVQIFSITDTSWTELGVTWKQCAGAEHQQFHQHGNAALFSIRVSEVWHPADLRPDFVCVFSSGAGGDAATVQPECGQRHQRVYQPRRNHRQAHPDADVLSATRKAPSAITGRRGFFRHEDYSSSSASVVSATKPSSVALSSSRIAFPVAASNRTFNKFPGFPDPLLKRNSFSQSISPSPVMKLRANPCVRRFPNLVRRTSYSSRWLVGVILHRGEDFQIKLAVPAQFLPKGLPGQASVYFAGKRSAGAAITVADNGIKSLSSGADGLIDF